MTKDELEKLVQESVAETSRPAWMATRDRAGAILSMRVTAALLAHGEDEAASFPPAQAALRLARLAPREYLDLQRAAHRAAQEVPEVPDLEAEARAEKLAADTDLAKRDFATYKAQRTAETEARNAR
jgi:hypothetical protein